MDTSGDVCSVAVLRNGQFVTEHAFRHGMHLSERLFEHIEGVLQEADAVLDDVTAFAVGAGAGIVYGDAHRRHDDENAGCRAEQAALRHQQPGSHSDGVSGDGDV